MSYQGAAPDHPDVITLSHEGASIGRRQDNSLVLPDEKRYISGHHAKIEYRAPDYYIVDTSTNGVLINDSSTPLGKGNSAKLNDGDRLHIGDYTLIAELISAQEPAISAIEPLDLPPVGPLADQNFDFPDDPFADLNDQHKDVIKEVIEKNKLIPEEWQKSEKEPGPLDFPDQDVSASEATPEEEKPQRSDFEHIPGYKEAFQPYQEEKAQQPAEEEPKRATIPEDIFAEDWSFLEEQKAGESEPPQAEIPPPEPPPPVETVQTPPREPASPPPPPPAKPEAVKPAERPSGFQDELIANFLRGAGLEDDSIAQAITPETFYLIGKILRASIQGTMDVLLSRAKIKSEMHLDVTMIRPRENNPIKFSVSSDEALSKLLAPHEKGYLAPEEAIEEAFDDIRAHQYSVLAGMQTALLAVLKRFDPEKLKQRLQSQNPVSASIPIQRRAKLWDLFEQLYEEIGHEAQDNFYHLFGQAFAESYQQQIQNLKAAKRDIPL